LEADEKTYTSLLSYFGGRKDGDMTPTFHNILSDEWDSEAPTLKEQSIKGDSSSTDMPTTNNQFIIPIQEPIEEEKLTLMPVCNQGDFLVESTEIKRRIVLEEVSTTGKIPEEIDKSLDECNEVGHDKLLEVLPPVEDTPHQQLFFMISKILFYITGLLKNAVTLLELENEFF